MRWLYISAGVLFVVVGIVYWPWERQQGAPKVPVSGWVTVNGLPGEYMVVRFQSENVALVGQDRQPVAGADEFGYFEMSSFGGNDGAVPGEYIVTFYWPTNPLTMGRDRLQGRFSDPQKSEYRVTIDEEVTVLPAFDILIPDEQILPLEFDPTNLTGESALSSNMDGSFRQSARPRTRN